MFVAQEFLISGLKMEVDDTKLSLYVDICNKQEDPVACGLGDITLTCVSRFVKKHDEKQN